MNRFHPTPHFNLTPTLKNPKITNVSLAWNKTSSELIWIADSKIYAKPETLSILVKEIQVEEDYDNKNKKSFLLISINSSPLVFPFEDF